MLAIPRRSKEVKDKIPEFQKLKIHLQIHIEHKEKNRKQYSFVCSSQTPILSGSWHPSPQKCMLTIINSQDGTGERVGLGGITHKPTHISPQSCLSALLTSDSNFCPHPVFLTSMFNITLSCYYQSLCFRNTVP